MSKKIRIALTDDHKLMRAGVRVLLEQIPDFEVVIEAANGEELIKALHKKRAHIVLLDIDMPVMNGIETIEVLQEKFPRMKVIMLSLHDEDRFIIHLMELGASGYLLKDAEPEEMEKAIRTVKAGEIYFNDNVSKVMFRKATNKTVRSKKVFNHKVDLTERELEVLKLICEGMTNAQIAEEVNLSQRTIEGNRLKMLNKLKLNNTAGLVAYAIKNQIV
ncbi:MAG: response regulator transcription factor [Spirosomaceae bacterium]|nr:response regulator transcription factor [Spirosomataceae bacterium]